MTKSKIMVALTLCLFSWASQTGASERWYSEEQVARGEKLFRQNCAICHGQNAEATPNWKQTDANGNYPPPPLNGTAHAWHHDLDLLRRTIREGGKALGGVMPGFADRLDAGEIDSIIAFFQSKWTDDIYRRWAGRFEVSELPSLTDVVVAANRPLTKLLRQRIGSSEIDGVEETDIDDVWQVQIGNRFIYLLDGGKYALTGDLINLEDGLNLTERARRIDVITLLASFDDKELIVFPAAGNTRATLDVFTDTSCPFCQKLHGEIGELQAAGITVRYIPYPRGGSRGPGYETLKSVWCAENRQQAMTDAKNQKTDGLPPGNCARAAIVDRGYQAGNRIGIGGTPALFTEDGEKIEGYRPHQELISILLQ